MSMCEVVSKPYGVISATYTIVGETLNSLHFVCRYIARLIIYNDWAHEGCTGYNSKELDDLSYSGYITRR